jgi:trans-2,3-dihydro-3-hydroxyanthranilate isomerase
MARQMSNAVFYLVDVFAEEKFAGNQLAVVQNAGSLNITLKQKIANEFHFSESTFLLSDQKQNGGYDVRVFTPFIEVPFAGHPTLGTAYVIKQFIDPLHSNEIILNLKVGQITVTFRKDEDGSEIVWMKQLFPTFGKIFEASTFSEILNLDVSEFDSYPIQEVSTGLPFIIVPLKSLKAVKQAKVNLEKQLQAGEEFRRGILVFCPQTYHKENDLNVRVFVDAYGIPEDPATGSGNGCLAGYLSKYQYFGKSLVKARVEQGYEIGRPSLLRIEAEKKDGNIHIFVGGKVVLVAKGELV